MFIVVGVKTCGSALTAKIIDLEIIPAFGEEEKERKKEREKRRRRKYDMEKVAAS